MDAPTIEDSQEQTQSRPSKGGFLEVLRIPAFRWFWLSQSISVLGDRVYAVALPFLLFELGGSATELGRLLAAFTVTQLFSLIFVGVLVDYHSRRNIMLLVNLLRFALLLTIVGLLVTNTLLMWHLYPLAAIFGICTAIFTPSSTSFVAEVVPKEGLNSASALRAISNQLASVLGPPLGGAFVAGGGLLLAFSFNAGTFVVAIIFLLLIRLSNQKHETRVFLGFLQNLKEGIHYVRGSSWLWGTILLFSVINVFITSSIVLVFPVLAEVRFEGASSLGWLLSSMALGALAGALSVMRIKNPRKRGIFAYLNVIACGLSLLGLSIAPTLLYGVLATFFLGGFLTIFSIIWETTLQNLVPKELLGRVTSIDMLSSYALLPFGYLFLGDFIDRFSLTYVLLNCGVLTILFASFGFLIKGVRTLD